MKRLWPSDMIYGKASTEYMSRLNRALAQIVLISC
ncbi:DNA excision repair ERCC-1 -like protein [Gossypium arboreum]|uniref:DNA excision repair ERCC-1-like protein n=1 Tax=Gossypium arboreum TaxID=29729 RepID=A0A0B0N6S0_GOSAR|nr:DNA excision repair ERCC-1 -like protein [Gossypium arboreum]